MKDISYGITLFNNADFFEAHDFFEDLWFESKRDEKDFYQGMVQISVGSYHLICGNTKGAKSQFLKGSDKLRRYFPSYLNINLEKLIKDVEVLIKQIDLLYIGKSRDVNLNLIPKIKEIN